MVYPLVRFIQEARWWMRFKEILLSSSSLIDCPALLLQGLILRVQFIHLIRIPFSFYGIQKDGNLFLNWSIVALECCVRVYCTTKWIGYMYPYIRSLLSLPLTPPSRPSRSSRGTELSSLCYIAASHCLSALRMVVYIYVSALLPTLPSSQSRVHVAVFYVCVSVPARQIFHLYHFSICHIYV